MRVRLALRDLALRRLELLEQFEALGRECRMTVGGEMTAELREIVEGWRSRVWELRRWKGLSGDFTAENAENAESAGKHANTEIGVPGGIHWRSLYRVAERVRAGDYGALLSGVRARRRGSRRLGEDVETRLRAQLARWRFQHPSAPVAALHDLALEYSRRNELPEPPEAWTRREVSSIMADESFRALSTRGTRGHNASGPYIRIDKSALPPGAQYVVDHRVHDCLVIASDGRLVRPWHTYIVDNRTLCPIGWLVLETAPNADSVLVALANAMLPKEENDQNRHLDLGRVCGIPDVGWLFDNGKDFSERRIQGMEIDLARRTKRILSDGDLRQMRSFVGQAHAERGDARDSHLVFGLMTETETGVRRAAPYNARGKIVERCYRDIAGRFDALAPGYVGNRPEARPERTNEMRRSYERLWKEGATPSELARGTGFWTIQEFMRNLECHLWTWATREGNAESLVFEGRQYAPLMAMQRFSERRRVPSRETLAMLSLRPEVRKTTRATITVMNRVYGARELAAISGRNVVVRYSPLSPECIYLVGVEGEPALAQPLKIGEVQRLSATATREDLASAMAELNGTRKGERARVRDLVGAADDRENPIAAQARRIREANEGRAAGRKRGQISGGAGADYTVVEAIGARAVETERVQIAEGTTGRRLRLWEDE